VLNPQNAVRFYSFSVIVQAAAAAFNADLGTLVYHTQTRRRKGECSRKTDKTATRGKDRVILQR